MEEENTQMPADEEATTKEVPAGEGAEEAESTEEAPAEEEAESTEEAPAEEEAESTEEAPAEEEAEEEA